MSEVRSRVFLAILPAASAASPATWPALRGIGPATSPATFPAPSAAPLATLPAPFAASPATVAAPLAGLSPARSIAGEAVSAKAKAAMALNVAKRRRFMADPFCRNGRSLDGNAITRAQRAPACQKKSPAAEVQERSD